MTEFERDRLYLLYDNVMSDRREPGESPEMFLQFCFRLHGILERYHRWVSDQSELPSNEQSRSKLVELIGDTELIPQRARELREQIDAYYAKKFALPKVEQQLKQALQASRNWKRDFLINLASSLAAPIVLYLLVFVLLMLFGDAKLSELLDPTRWLGSDGGADA